MQELIELFTTAASCTEQDNYFEAEADLVSGAESADYCRRTMVSNLLKWVNNQVNDHGFEVATLGKNLIITCDHDFAELEMNEAASNIVELLEVIKKDDEEAILRFADSL